VESLVTGMWLSKLPYTMFRCSEDEAAGGNLNGMKENFWTDGIEVRFPEGQWHWCSTRGTYSIQTSQEP
jgi:hypothetical protein